MPVEWTIGIINPIPKPDEKDARDPLNFTFVCSIQNVAQTFLTLFALRPDFIFNS